MSIRKNTWNLDAHYDLTKSGQNDYSSVGGPYSLYLTGGGVYGELGQNDIIPRSSPIQVPGTWTSYATMPMSKTISATKSDGTLWVWGMNNNGELGQNNQGIHRSSPVQVPGTQWSYAAAGGYYCITKKTDGTLWAWGQNAAGNLGVNDAIPRSSPVQIPGTYWDKVGTSREQSYVIKTDGTLWSWGYGYGGGQGVNSVVNRSSPIQIPGTQWSSVVGGYASGKALKSDGTLWTWGLNANYGLLGMNDTIPRSSPVQVPGTQWSAIASGNYHTIATKTDGTLWTWGVNTNGDLGQNDRVPRSSPIQIPGTQWDSSNLQGHRYGSRCTKTDGTLWAWGLGNYGGEVGNNTSAIGYSSPIQIPGTQWELGGVGITTGNTNHMQFTAFLK
jgi:alpha-tubulin suppressor-like RCC1 family protein